jgi:tRNA-uridine 2-sulfurtransferase
LGETQKQDNQREVEVQGVLANTGETSNEICFLQDADYADFIRLRRPAAFIPGEIVDTRGRVLGRHSGLPGYTIGQRRGMGVAASEPLYVIRLEAGTNRVVAGLDRELWTRQVRVEAMNWLTPPPASGLTAWAQIRYRQTPQKVNVRVVSDLIAELEFEKPVRAVTPGQVAAVYLQDRLVGGGLISQVSQPEAA